MDAILELAKSQHTLGVPFKRVTIRTQRLSKTMVKMLESWVGEVIYHENRWRIPISDTDFEY